MKKILACLLIICSFYGAHAQIEKGKVLLGGQLSYNRNTNNYGNIPPGQVAKAGNFNVAIGKALTQNAVFGVMLSYSPQYNTYITYVGTNPVSNREKSRAYSAGVFYRRYKQIAGKFYFFGEGVAGYTGFHRTQNVISSNYKTTYQENGGQITFTPGISYNLFKKLQAEVLVPSLLSIRYSHNSIPQNQFSISTGLPNTNFGSLGIGFHLIL